MLTEFGTHHIVESCVPGLLIVMDLLLSDDGWRSEDKRLVFTSFDFNHHEVDGGVGRACLGVPVKGQTEQRCRQQT